MNETATSIVIPVHNRASLTRQCLSILTKSLPDTIEIVVVDDGSADVTPQVLSEYESRIRVVRHATARGFASACNDGAAAARGDYLVLLNNDTIPQPGWLDALIAHAANYPAAAAVGAKLLFPNDTIQHAGVVIATDRNPRHIYMGFPSDHPAVNKSRRFQVVTAACMLLRRDAFEDAGGFDEAFMNGFEDVDLCLRLGERGHEIRYCHLSVLHHFEKGTRRDEQFEQNLSLYRRRWTRRVRTDEFDFYVDDGLLRLDYKHQYPIGMEISPLLAVLEEEERERAADRLLAKRSKQVFLLLRENLELKLGDGEADARLPKARCKGAEPIKAALFVSAEPADPKRYRCDHQAEQLAMLGVSVDVEHSDNVRWGEIAEQYGMFVLHRVPFDEHLRWFIGVARRKGKPVVFDTDDLVFDAEAAHGFFAGLEHLDAAERRDFEKRVRGCDATLRTADAVTASTQPLATLARELNDKVVVTPNAVSSAMVEQADAVGENTRRARANGTDGGEITIAYMSGSPTHDRDFLEAADAVVAVLERYDFARLLIVGDLRLSQAFSRVRDRITEVPFQAWHRLPEVLAEVDINLAPLERDNPFTESKSCIKYLEAGLLGIPTVASPRSDFTRAIEHRRNGLLADTPDQWQAALDELVSSPDRRDAIGAAAYDDVRANHTTAAHARSLHRAFVDLVDATSPATRSFARSLARYLSSRGHTVAERSPGNSFDGADGRIPAADASIATDAAAAASVAADDRSLFKINVVVDQVSAVPTVLELPLRQIVFGEAAEDVPPSQTSVDPDRVDASGAEALRRIEAVLVETCFVRLTPSLEAADGAAELTPTRRT
jgi:GT2 family glycosyltransferase